MMICIFNDFIRIETELTDFYGIKSLAEHIVPIALSFYLGSWSDSLGRHHCHLHLYLQSISLAAHLSVGW